MSSPRILLNCVWTLGFVISNVLSTCRKEDQCACPKIYSPVCGSDGKTYNNQCLLNCHNQRTGQCVQAVCEGRCPDECICPAIYDPVCGSNGKTYSNECLLDCHNKKTGETVTVAYRGNCTKEGCFCPLIYDPVCGCDGKTYGNLCQLTCANIENPGKNVTFAYKGECDGCVCTADFNPVCGSDGKTYSNKCQLDCENKRTCGNVTAVYNGTCDQAVLACGKRRCPHTPLNVCGTDGKTYGSSCALDCSKEIFPDLEGVRVAHRGACQSQTGAAL